MITNQSEKIFLFFLLVLSLSFTSFAATELLGVGTCSAAGCTVVGWNDFDNTADGSSLTAGTTDTLTMYIFHKRQTHMQLPPLVCVILRLQ